MMKIHNRSVQCFLIIGFFLLLEWSYPLKSFGGIRELSLFLLYIIICFLLFLFRLPILFHWFVNFIYIFLALNQTFYQKSFLQFTWIKPFFADLTTNIKIIFDGNWMNLTESFRTLLFYILIWLVVYLLYYWIAIRKRIFLFLLLTIIYISIFDTYTSYDGKFSMIRTVILGFIGLGVLYFDRMVEEERITVTRSLRTKWLVSLSVMVFISTTVAALIPKAGPIWPDPVPFIESFAKGEGKKGKGINRIGYDSDDSILGGPFLRDDRLVFRVETPKKNYWVVETKDLYTGKGWGISQEYARMWIEGGTPFLSDDFLGMREEEITEAKITMFETRNPHIIYPKGMELLDFIDYPGRSFIFNNSNEKFEANFLQANDSYFIEYRQPIYEIEKLRQVKSDEQYELFHSDYNMYSFFIRYTQLPETLPMRVRDLAHQLTEKYDNWYDQAKAIEDYLKGPKFTYDDKNVAYPGENQDYVDQFLFETYRGYCDNFSTAMVVLLRSVGIPARWIKGYTSGELVKTDTEKTIYEITNNHAHSWVEAYFPNIGWVPFEPTKGYTNIANFAYSTESDRDEPLTNPGNEPREPNQPEQRPNPPEKSDVERNNQTTQTKTLSLSSWLQEHKGLLIYSFIFIVLVIWLLFKYRIKWLPYWYIVKYWKKNDVNSFTNAYLVLLKQLERYGMPKKQDESLRQFARKVDTHFSTSEMSRLTNLYEKVIYRNESSFDPSVDWHTAWKQLMKTIRI